MIGEAFKRAGNAMRELVAPRPPRIVQITITDVALAAEVCNADVEDVRAASRSAAHAFRTTLAMRQAVR